MSVDIPESVRRAWTPPRGANIVQADPMFVAIHGTLQCDAQKVDVRRNERRTRIYVRWTVMQPKGLEWDGAKHVGKPIDVHVVTLTGTDAFVGQAKLMHWAHGHDVASCPVARAIFEYVEPTDQAGQADQAGQVPGPSVSPAHSHSPE